MKLATILAVLLLVSAARSHDGLHDDWYASLIRADGAHCCNQVDCRPHDDWRMRGELYQVRVDGVWRDVPSANVITHRGNPTGRAQLCLWYGEIRCFVPGAQG